MFRVTINNILVIILLIIMLSYPLFYFHYVNIIIYFSPCNLLGERLDKPCFFFHQGYCQSDIIIIIIYILYISIQIYLIVTLLLPPFLLTPLTELISRVYRHLTYITLNMNYVIIETYVSTFYTVYRIVNNTNPCFTFDSILIIINPL